MQRPFAACAILLVVAGCASGPYSGPVVGPPGAPGNLPNPLFVQCGEPEGVWETVVDVVDDYFRIEHEEPIRAMGGTIMEGRLETYPQPGATVLEPWLHDSANWDERVESSLQTIRRHATVRVVPTNGGYWIDVAVFKELEDLRQPAMATAGAATLRYDGTLNHVASPTGEQETKPGWIPQGRDAALEQRILGHLQSRFLGAGAPVPMRFGSINGGGPTPPGPVVHQVAYRPSDAEAVPSSPPRPTIGLHAASARRPESPATASQNSDLQAASAGPVTNRHGAAAPLPTVVSPTFRPAPEQLQDPPQTIQPTPLPNDGRLSEGFPWADPAAAGGNPLLAPRGACYRIFHSPRLQEFLTDTYFDYSHFYSPISLFWLTTGVGKAAISANTQADQEFRNWYQDNVRTSSTVSLSSVVRQFGNGGIMIPVMAAAALLGPVSRRPVGEGIGQWGDRCVRTVVTGGPWVLALQWGLGASRPGESPYDSYWKPLDDTNSVSGHAFIGAIPFITAAKMSDRLVVKAGFYALSTLPAWSRVNDDAHYLSQVYMGWWFAYLAATAVGQTEMRKQSFVVTPLAMGDGMGLGLTFFR